MERSLHMRRGSNVTSTMEILPVSFLPFGTYRESDSRTPTEINVIRRLLASHQSSSPPPSPLPDPSELAIAYHNSPSLLPLLSPFLVLANHPHSDLEMATLLIRSVLSSTNTSPVLPTPTLLPQTPLASLVEALYFDQGHSLDTLRAALASAAGISVLPARVVEECLLVQAARPVTPASPLPVAEPLSELRELVVALYADSLGLPALARMLDRVGICVQWAVTLIARTRPEVAARLRKEVTGSREWREGGVGAGRCACAACAALEDEGLLGAWVEETTGTDEAAQRGGRALRDEIAAVRRGASRAGSSRWVPRWGRRPSVAEERVEVLWEYGEDDGDVEDVQDDDFVQVRATGLWTVGSGASESEDEDGFTKVEATCAGAL